MMAYPYDGKRIILALQIDHSRVAGYFAADKQTIKGTWYQGDAALPLEFAKSTASNR